MKRAYLAISIAASAVLCVAIVVRLFYWNPVVAAPDYGECSVAKWKGNAVAALTLSFDDNGLGNNRGAIAAILEAYGVRGSFNVISYTRIADMFVDMFRRGHELGSHSVNHIRLADDTSTDTIAFEVAESKRVIEKATNAPCVSYVSPYGSMREAEVFLARSLYISIRGTEQGVNPADGARLFDLRIAPSPPYRPQPGEFWSDEEYCNRLSSYVDGVVRSSGWGIVTFHDMAVSGSDAATSKGLNSGAAFTETFLRDFLSSMTKTLGSRLWIAPQGTVARYYMERSRTVIQTDPIRRNSLALRLGFDGDKSIFDEPLTMGVVIPERWLDGKLIVTQGARKLPFRIEASNNRRRLICEAVPGGEVVRIVFKGRSVILRAFARIGSWF